MFLLTTIGPPICVVPRDCLSVTLQKKALLVPGNVRDEKR